MRSPHDWCRREFPVLETWPSRRQVFFDDAICLLAVVCGAELASLLAPAQVRFPRQAGQQVGAELVHLAAEAVAPPGVLGALEEKPLDAGLVHLKGMTNLESFGLNNTQVTDVGTTLQPAR